MTYTPKNLTLWTHPENYGGATWNGYYSAGFGQTRDSGALERSNFAVVRKALENASNRVDVVREGHWACGWVEWIAIPSDDYAALRVADALQERCADYPVLDEDDLSDREQEEADNVWAHCYGVRERVKYIRAHREQFEFQNLSDMLSCVRGKYFAGYASELID
jgi:hypothetical protein